jgi:hypothetical protein
LTSQVECDLCGTVLKDGNANNLAAHKKSVKCKKRVHDLLEAEKASKRRKGIGRFFSAATPAPAPATSASAPATPAPATPAHATLDPDPVSASPATQASTSFAIPASHDAPASPAVHNIFTPSPSVPGSTLFDDHIVVASLNATQATQTEVEEGSQGLPVGATWCQGYLPKVAIPFCTNWPHELHATVDLTFNSETKCIRALDCQHLVGFGGHVCKKCSSLENATTVKNIVERSLQVDLEKSTTNNKYLTAVQRQYRYTNLRTNRGEDRLSFLNQKKLVSIQHVINSPKVIE